MAIGIVERELPYWVLHVMMALRFGMLTLATVTVIWTVSDMIERWKSGNKSIPRLYYVSKVFIGLAVLLFTPSAFMRMSVMKLNPELAAICTIMAMSITCAYFILTQTMKHLYSGEPRRTAWVRTVPLILGTCLLMGIGANVNVGLH